MIMYVTYGFHQEEHDLTWAVCEAYLAQHHPPSSVIVEAAPLSVAQATGRITSEEAAALDALGIRLEQLQPKVYLDIHHSSTRISDPCDLKALRAEYASGQIAQNRIAVYASTYPLGLYYETPSINPGLRDFLCGQTDIAAMFYEVTGRTPSPNPLSEICARLDIALVGVELHVNTDALGVIGDVFCNEAFQAGIELLRRVKNYVFTE